MKLKTVENKFYSLKIINIIWIKTLWVFIKPVKIIAKIIKSGNDTYQHLFINQYSMMNPYDHIYQDVLLHSIQLYYKTKDITSKPFTNINKKSQSGPVLQYKNLSTLIIHMKKEFKILIHIFTTIMFQEINGLIILKNIC